MLPIENKPDTSHALLCYYNWLSKEGLTEPAQGWIQAIKDAGYDGIQFIEPLELPESEAAARLGLRVCGSGRINEPADALRLAEAARSHALEALTVHVGWGNEDDSEAGRLIGAVLDATEKTSIPLFVETHRATIFQDQWRTLQFIKRFPQLRFNGDLSHWYTGQEMVYGDFEKKLTFIQPMLERVWFMHGRIGNPGCMQVNIGTIERALQLPYVCHFQTLWGRVFDAFLQRPQLQKEFCFAVELLDPGIYYARTFGGEEESDRWEQSLVLRDIAQRTFARAEAALRNAAPRQG